MARRKKKAEEAQTFSEAVGFAGIFQNEKIHFFIGLLLFCVGVFVCLAFLSFLSTGDADLSLLESPREGEILNEQHIFRNSCGSVGAHVSHFLIKECFGLAAFMVPVFLLSAGVSFMHIYPLNTFKWFMGTMIIMIWSSVALSEFASPFFTDCWFNPGGKHGLYVCSWIKNLVGTPGLLALLALVALAFLTYVSSETVIIIRKMINPVKFFTERIKFTVTNGAPAEPEDKQEETLKEENQAPEEDEETEEKDEPGSAGTAALTTDGQEGGATDTTTEKDIPATTGETGRGAPAEDGKDVPMEITRREEERPAEGKQLVGTNETEMAPYDPKRDLENYRYPTLDLLKKYDTDGKPNIDMAEQTANKNRIVEVLRNFGVEISSIKATVGATITLYEITPAQGVRISKIKNLEDDIALSLSALGIRIIAPIPGKGTIGIEVPNAKPCIVSMESILNSKKFQEANMELPCAIGKTITNEVFMFDLAKIPHLLVAGATGQGKSVGLNAIITSLLYKKHPAELKIVLIDPKKVEFSIYESIANHFLAKVPDDENNEAIITDVTKVVRTLNSLCKEMDTRYDLLKKAGARNIKEYNKKFITRRLNPEHGHHYMPYIVVVIDEFGDLIMTAGKEIELPIARIAQLARAVGIHMVIATQRPTTTIITGNIKANFPGRIAFKVSAMIDSKTILDRPGANQLIGRGDMLFLNGNEPVRVQCAFVDTPEVERINEFISKQQGYLTPFELPEPDSDTSSGDEGGTDIDAEHLDRLFEEAARIVVINQTGSTSMIQRKLRIGFNRAGRLTDQLEKMGVVGTAMGSKSREVLIKDEASLNALLSKIKR